MPKRKIKEEKPKKRLGKKELLIAPIAMGAATLVALVIIPTFAPPPDPSQVCLKPGQHNVESFQLHPRVEIVVDGQQMILPDSVGKQPKNGQDCLRPIHTDEAGNILHIEYIRPIRFTMADFMKVYAYDGQARVVDNSTGMMQTLNLTNYDVQYSYFSEAGEFTKVAKPSDVPAFPADNKMVARVELTSKQ